MMFTGRFVFTGGDVHGEIRVHKEIGVHKERGRCFNRDYAVLIGRSGMVLLRGDAWGGIPGSCCQAQKENSRLNVRCCGLEWVYSYCLN